MSKRISEKWLMCVQTEVSSLKTFIPKYLVRVNIQKHLKFLRIIDKMGESSKFGIDMSDDPKAAVELFLKECGLKMTEYIQFGVKLDIEPFYCIVEAEKL